MQDEEAANEPTEHARLPQTEAIMEAIIKSSKPLPINPGKEAKDIIIPAQLSRLLQRISDSLVPYRILRWLVLCALLGAFAARVVILGQHFFAAYVLGIYMLNQGILFISPATEDDNLPMGPSSGEFRPFIRALSEFKLWSRGTIATMVSLLATCLESLDLEVDGVALLLYFSLLFAYTMKLQIAHMIKYGYVPWNGRKQHGKVKDEAFAV